MPSARRPFYATLVAIVLAAGAAVRTASAESLCDPSTTNCRTPLLTLIDNEKVGIDVAFWFMTDNRYVSHIISRWNAGVPVRIIVDPRANAGYDGNATSLDEFASAGIPMIKKSGAGIMHWKAMIFAGQETVEFGSANYSPNAFVPVTPYENYVGESIFFEDDPAIVNSFKRKFDDVWVDTSDYGNYANVTSRVRVYPSYSIDASLNFPPYQSFANRVINAENAEALKIDVDMYRITQKAHSDALIAAHSRGVSVRYFGETKEYRDPSRLWVAWNMDRRRAAVRLADERHRIGRADRQRRLQQRDLHGDGQRRGYLGERRRIPLRVLLAPRRRDDRGPRGDGSGRQRVDESRRDDPAVHERRVGARLDVGDARQGARLPATADSRRHEHQHQRVGIGAALGQADARRPAGLRVRLNRRIELVEGRLRHDRAVGRRAGGPGGHEPRQHEARGGDLRPRQRVLHNRVAAAERLGAHRRRERRRVGNLIVRERRVHRLRIGRRHLERLRRVPVRVPDPQRGRPDDRARREPDRHESLVQGGVMIRNTLSASSAYAMMLVSALEGTAFQYRASAGASAQSLGGTASAAPYWVKVVRAGSKFSGYQSSDGSSWRLIGSASIKMGSSVEIGLAVTSHDNSRLATAAFDHVS